MRSPSALKQCGRNVWRGERRVWASVLVRAVASRFSPRGWFLRVVAGKVANAEVRELRREGAHARTRAVCRKIWGTILEAGRERGVCEEAEA